MQEKSDHVAPGKFPCRPWRLSKQRRSGSDKSYSFSNTSALPHGTSRCLRRVTSHPSPDSAVRGCAPDRITQKRPKKSKRIEGTRRWCLNSCATPFSCSGSLRGETLEGWPARSISVCALQYCRQLVTWSSPRERFVLARDFFFGGFFFPRRAWENRSECPGQRIEISEGLSTVFLVIWRIEPVRTCDTQSSQEMRPRSVVETKYCVVR